MTWNRQVADKNINNILFTNLHLKTFHSKKKRNILIITKGSTNFNNTNISGNKEWCAQILNLNKTLGLHGVTHEFNEFQTDRNQEYLDNGISMFEQCFGFKPDRFKPPQLNISKNNIQLIENNEMELMMNFHQITRKVYHCNDSDVIKNSVMDWI